MALSIAFCLFFLTIVINYTPQVQTFFSGLTRMRITQVLVNSVFFWLAFLLFVAFLRWRRAELRRNEMEMVLSSISPDVLLVVDPERNILMCSQSLQRMLGYSPREALHRKTDLLYCDRRAGPKSSHGIHKALDGFHVGLVTGRRKDGGAVPLEIISAELSAREGAVLLLRDITERVRQQEASRQLEATVRQREKLESLGVLAGGIAHDFNNLLAGILGNAELAAAALEPGQANRKSMEEIIRASRKAAVLCKDLLAYSGEGKWHVEPLDLSGVVRSMSHILEIAISKRHRLEYRLAADLPAVDGDAGQIQQVIYNLVRNSAEALGEDDGAISIVTGVMECSAAWMESAALEAKPPAGLYVFVRVTDTGCGMDPATIGRIFEPFFTTKNVRRGLGLASVRGIVQGHQGTIRVESEPGHGTTFTVLLRPSAGKAPAGGAPAEEAWPPDGSAARWDARGTVLVVEDETTVLAFVSQALAGVGLNVIAASSGEEGLQLFRDQRASIDAVLMDMTMPGMGGEQAWREMKALSPGVKVIFTSGHRPDEAEWLREAAGFIQKPFDLPTLLGGLRRALEKA